MMHIRPLFIGTALAAGLFATFGQAQSSGEITVMIAGAERTIPVWAEQSDWSGSEDWPSINIHVRDFTDNGEEPIVVSLGFEASRWEPSAPELDMSLYEIKERVAVLYGREEQERGGLSVTLDDHSIDGTQLSISGSFEGMLGPSDNFGNDIDLSQGVPVTGTFSVTLEQLE
ncbi:hypothetical protein PE067_03525 [Paracoccus sp. DMF-8]|uniref:hypothetical protein n=1 Tax=Paracoccus sp. DMF-8 TaxID=3019445 RepID=UPI0023E7FFAB|nr:hypothetical protein [Paracoccus sp. DMF-8]MDF3605310.1 hypothetical protein [Paracoccus sp. DMF-8]